VAALPRTRAPAATAAAAHAGGLVDLRLANGARILVLPTAGGPGGGGAAAVQLWVGAGTSAERPDEHGCAHLLEHMLFKPLPETCPEGHVEGEGGGPAVDLASGARGDRRRQQRVHQPRRDGGARDGAGGRGRVGGGPDRRRDAAPGPRRGDAGPGARGGRRGDRSTTTSPGSGCSSTCCAACTAATATGARSSAWPARSAATARPACAATIAAAYAGSRVTLVVVGAVEVAKVVATARRALGSLPAARPLPAEPPPASRAVGPRRAPAPRRRPGGAPDARLAGARGRRSRGVAIDVASVVLGHGEASRLVRETRRRDQLVSEVSCSCESLRRAGSFISAHTTGPQAEAAVAAMFAQVARLRASRSTPTSWRGPGRSSRATRSTARRPCRAGPTRSATTRPCSATSAASGPTTPRSPSSPPSRCGPRAPACSTPAPASAPSCPRAHHRRGRQAARAGDRRQVPGHPKARPRAPDEAPPPTASASSASTSRRPARPRHRRRSVPMAAGWLVWPGGQAREPAALAGAAATTAALLTRGDARHERRRRSAAASTAAPPPRRLRRAQQRRPALGVAGPRRPELLDLAPRVRPLAPLPRGASSPRSAASPCRSSPPRPTTRPAGDPRDARGVLRRPPLQPPAARHPAGLRALTGPRLRELWAQRLPAARRRALPGRRPRPRGALAQIGLFLGTGRKGQVRKARRSRARLPPGPRERTIFKDREQAHIALGFPGLVPRRPPRAGPRRAHRGARRPERAPVHRPARAPGPRLRGLGQQHRRPATPAT
jgi:hypothetical protein